MQKLREAKIVRSDHWLGTLSNFRFDILNILLLSNINLFFISHFVPCLSFRGPGVWTKIARDPKVAPILARHMSAF